MRWNRKYLVAVALLVVLALAFGLSGTTAPLSNPVSPQQESSVPPYFIIPPTFDSGWIDITARCGQYFNIIHDLNTTDVFIDITGKQTLGGGEHQRHLSGTGYSPGWSRKYGGTDGDKAYSMVQTGDGGYALAGWTESSGAGSGDFWLVKTDASGNHQWNRTYGGTGVDCAHSLVYEEEWWLDLEAYVIAGYTESLGKGGQDFWLVKTDALGVELWNRTYGGTENDAAYSVVQTSDGGYALAGYTYSYDDGFSDFWLVKTDASGNHQWNRTYGGIGSDAAYSVVQTSDGGYALAGNTPYSWGTIWLVKTNSTGHMQWHKSYGGIDTDAAHSVIQTDDGGYAIAGYTFSFGAGRCDLLLVKTDSDGNMQWQRRYGGGDLDYAYSVVQTSDGGYALAGYTTSFGAGSGDFWLVKTEVEHGLAPTGLTDSTITLYRGETDAYWNYVRVRIWTIQEPTWQYGDIDMDGDVDDGDLFILARNYWKTGLPHSAQAQTATNISVATTAAVAAVAVALGLYRPRKKPN